MPPDGITGVLRADTFLWGCLGSTYLAGPDGVRRLRAIQKQYAPRTRLAALGVSSTTWSAHGSTSTHHLAAGACAGVVGAWCARMWRMGWQ